MLENVVELYSEESTKLSYKIIEWLSTEHNLIYQDDYQIWTEHIIGRPAVIIKFYDETNDSIGKTPEGFVTLFRLRWS